MAESIIPTEIDAIETVITELSELGRSFRSSFRSTSAPSITIGCSSEHPNDMNTDDNLQYWEVIERLPTLERLRLSLFDEGQTVVDITKLGDADRRLFVGKLIHHIQHDNLNLLRKIKKRTDQ